MEHCPPAIRRERVLIAGAGIAGLLCALDLADEGFQVTVVERAGPPPEDHRDVICRTWRKPGVGQFKHTHAFRALFYEQIKTRFPKVLEQLLEAGAREIPTAASKSATGTKEPVKTLACRRPLLDAIIWRNVAATPDIHLYSQVVIDGLIAGSGPSGDVVVHGVTAGKRRFEADLVVDATGRNSPFAEWLGKLGCHLPQPVWESQLRYFSRFFSLLDRNAVDRLATPPVGDLGFIKFGVIAGDDGRFSVTFAVPEEDHALCRRLHTQQGFDEACMLIPNVREWASPDVSSPISPAAMMGDLRAEWRDFRRPRGRRLAGYLPVGDAFVRSNPLYGRGCTFAIVQSWELRKALSGNVDYEARARAYDQGVRRRLSPFFDEMLNLDQQATWKARAYLSMRSQRDLRQRLRLLSANAKQTTVRGNERLAANAALAHQLLRSPLQLWTNPLAWSNYVRHLLRAATTGIGDSADSIAASRQDFLEHIDENPPACLNIQRSLDSTMQKYPTASWPRPGNQSDRA